MGTSAAERAFGHIEPDELAEINASGVSIGEEAITFPEDPAALDAAASVILRQLGLVRADLERHREAFLKEEQVLHDRYARIMDPLRAREGWLGAMGAQMALAAKFPGKAKSRKVAFGTYGTKQVPERLSICDEAALLEWAKKNEPTIVQQKVTERVPQKAAAEYYTSTGDTPEGCAIELAHEEPVLKPELNLFGDV